MWTRTGNTFYVRLHRDMHTCAACLSQSAGLWGDSLLVAKQQLWGPPSQWIP